ncbi:hypothetical protein OEJ37_17325 [Burkholderia sp. BKH01]|nr:hypothetical protein [Burkholderia sp. BKH01]MCU9955121.1 hypothetical protein [Burkholderia sp. BKH01]
MVACVAACEDLRVRSQEHFHRVDEPRSALAEPQYGDRRLLRESGSCVAGCKRSGIPTRPDRVACRAEDRSGGERAAQVGSDRFGRDGHRARP